MNKKDLAKDSEKIKKLIGAMPSKELRDLVRELYQLSSSNREFLNARFLKNETSLKDFKKRIREALYPDFDSGKTDISFSKARKAISDFEKATRDSKQTLDLMIYYLEVGKEMMAAFGMDYEAFYNSMESMFRGVATRLKGRDRSLLPVFWDRLKKIERAARNVGYGYGDSLEEMMEELATFSSNMSVDLNEA